MRNATRLTILAPESIAFELLARVNGGCRPKCPPPAPAAATCQMNQMNVFQLPAPQAGAPAQSSEPEVETSVQIIPAGARA